VVRSKSKEKWHGRKESRRKEEGCEESRKEGRKEEIV
jgi:hypothetical protein